MRASIERRRKLCSLPSPLESMGRPQRTCDWLNEIQYEYAWMLRRLPADRVARSRQTTLSRSLTSKKSRLYPGNWRQRQVTASPVRPADVLLRRNLAREQRRGPINNASANLRVPPPGSGRTGGSGRGRKHERGGARADVDWANKTADRGCSLTSCRSAGWAGLESAVSTASNCRALVVASIRPRRRGRGNYEPYSWSGFLVGARSQTGLTGRAGPAA